MPHSPKVIYESAHLLALAKPFGMPSQNDPSGDPSLIQWANEYLGKPAHLLHRLDRPTGGLILLGKSKTGTAELSRQFQSREITKVYLAVVEGKWPGGQLTLEHHIGKLPGKNFVRAYDKPVRGSKSARLQACLVEESGGRTLLRIEPQTGRRHQIRAQLQRLKLSIVGDRKYGKSKVELPYQGIALWAYSLTFSEPRKGATSLQIPPPDLYPWTEFLDFQ